MASHDSALKAHRQNVKQREHNRQLRTRLRSALRDIRAAIDSEDPAKVKDALRNTISLVDKMAAKKLIHRNTAGRYKSRLQAASRRSQRPHSSTTAARGERADRPELLRSRSGARAPRRLPARARHGQHQLLPYEPPELSQNHVGNAARFEGEPTWRNASAVSRR